MQQTPVRVLVVDDQRPFRAAASAVLRRMPDFTARRGGRDRRGRRARRRGAAARSRAHGRAPARHRRHRRGGPDPRRDPRRASSCSAPPTPARTCSIRLDEPGVAGYLHKEELHGPALRRAVGPAHPVKWAQAAQPDRRRAASPATRRQGQQQRQPTKTAGHRAGQQARPGREVPAHPDRRRDLPPQQTGGGRARRDARAPSAGATIAPPSTARVPRICAASRRSRPARPSPGCGGAPR